MLPNWSSARSVNAARSPAVLVDEPASCSFAALAAVLTVTGRLPLIEDVVSSVTVTEREPEVFRLYTGGECPWPLSPAWKAYDPGRTACASFELKSTVPR